MGSQQWELRDLRDANVQRQEEWCPDQKPDLSFRGNELAGETGEACNVIKKLERERHGWRGSRATVDLLAEELADVVICADLVAAATGIDLQRAVQDKFNNTSRKNGLKTMLLPERKRSVEREKVLTDLGAMIGAGATIEELADYITCELREEGEAHKRKYPGLAEVGLRGFYMPFDSNNDIPTRPTWEMGRKVGQVDQLDVDNWLKGARWSHDRWLRALGLIT